MDGSCSHVWYLCSGMRTSDNIFWISCFGVPETITSDRGRNLLQMSGLSFSRCWTSCIAKWPLIILRRTVQSKDSTTASRMRFVLAPLWQLGLSYPGYSSDSVHSQGKRLVFPRLRQFLELQLFCQMSFCMEKNFLLTIFLKNSHVGGSCFLSLSNIIQVACCLRSCQPTSFTPPLSGCTKALMYPPSSAPTVSCAGDPSPSPSESGHGMRSFPSAAWRPTRMRTPRLAVRNAAADIEALAWQPSQLPPAQAVQLFASRSCFQTCCFLHLQLGHCQVTVQEPFFSHPPGGLGMPWTGYTFNASKDAVPAAPADPAHEVRPLKSSPPHCCPAIHSDNYLGLVLCCTVPVYKLVCIPNKLVLS